MENKVGIEKLKDLVRSAARIMNAVSSFLAKKGILSLYPVIAEAQAVAKTDWKAAWEEIKNLDTAEGADVEAVFNSELKLENASVQMKLQEAIDCVQEGFILAAEGYAQGMGLFARGKALVEKCKALVSGPVQA